jgi:hypothetical protein
MQKGYQYKEFTVFQKSVGFFRYIADITANIRANSGKMPSDNTIQYNKPRHAVK